MMDNVQTGDVLVMAPTPGNESLFQRGILLTSCCTHVEGVVRDSATELSVAVAAHPHYSLLPIRQRLQQQSSGAIVFGIYRWCEFAIEEARHTVQYVDFQDRFMRLARRSAVMKIPYDWFAIHSHAINWIMAKLRLTGIFPAALTKHREYKLYCVEDVFQLFWFAGDIDLHDHVLTATGQRQPLPHLVHIVRLIQSKKLRPVDGGDYGLHDVMRSEWQRT